MKNDIYKRNIMYRVRTINNRNILFGEDQCFELNELALMVWNNLNGQNTIDDLVDKISDQYYADKGTIRQDVTDFISEMARSNTIIESEYINGK